MVSFIGGGNWITCRKAPTVHGHKYLSPSIFFTIYFILNHIFSKKYFKAISGQIFMKFISRHAEFF